jgi:hypothetical protein
LRHPTESHRVSARTVWEKVSKQSVSTTPAVPGIAFGYDEGIRLGYCTTLNVLNEGLTRFEQFCREH